MIRKYLFLVLNLISVMAWAGTIQVIDKKASPGTGTVQVRCNVNKKVSLSITDTGANDLVGPTGIDFGDVDADGTNGKVPGTPQGADKARYVADFIFSATRTGTGNVTLTAERSIAGNFDATDGILVGDDGGALQPLSGAGGTVTVISNKPEGDFTKQLGITVHSSDSGALSSTLRFTLSAL